MYSGAYQRQIAEVTETEVDNFEGVQLGWNVAVNLDDNYKLPHLALVKEVTNSLYIFLYTWKSVFWFFPLYSARYVEVERDIYWDR